jgi:hypothetical protein
MAAPNYGQEIASSWEEVMGSSPQDNFHPTYWLINRLQEFAKSSNGGRSINGPIEYTNNTTVASYNDVETIDTTRVDVFDEFTYAWKQYAGTMVMSELEKGKNQGEGRKFDLQAGKMRNLRNSFFRVLNTDAYGDGTGNGSRAMLGLQALIPNNPATGTVGGINRATFTFWRPKQTSGAKTSTAFDNLRAAMRSIYNQSSTGVDEEHPDMASTERTVFEGYESLALPYERINRESPNDKLVSGFKNNVIMFKDLYLSYDDANPSGSMYIFNRRNFFLKYLKGYWMKGLGVVNPANQTVDVFRVMTICQFVTNNSRHGGVITSIT